MDWQRLAVLAYFAEAAYDHDRPPLWRRTAEGYTGGVFGDWRLVSAAELGLSLNHFDGDGFFTVDGILSLSSLEAFVIYSPSSHQVVLSVRGTEGSSDFGNYGAIAGNIDTLASKLETLLFQSRIFATDNSAHLLVTGHSLGGVIAEALSVFYRDKVDGGAFFGSPGSPLLDGFSLPADDFLHVARPQDYVGGFLFPASHAAATLKLDDYRFDSVQPAPLSIFPEGAEAHSSARYLNQISAAATSPLSSVIGPNVGSIAFLDDRESQTFDVAGSATAGHGYNTVVFGSRYDDAISYSGTLYPVFLDGRGGVDELSGGPLDDILAGGAGGDTLAGEGGSDWLVGGGDSDRYIFHPYEGGDTIADGGGGPLDVVKFYGHGQFPAIDYDWFRREGADLLIQIPGEGGGLALDLRIVGMGSNAGMIELFELYGANDAFIFSWDLKKLWAGWGQPVAPPAPSVPNHSQSNDFTSGNDTVTRGGGNDYLITRGQGQDSVDAGGGSDTLQVDYFWTDQPAVSFYGNGIFTYAAGPNGSIGRGTASNIERAVLIGGSGGDSLGGVDGNDIIAGEGGDDILAGGLGDDTLLGGAGDDYLVSDVDPFAGVLFGGGADWVDGGDGIDRWLGNYWDETRPIAFIADAAASSDGFTLVNGVHVRNVERVELTTGSGDDSIWAGGNTAGLYADTLAGDDFLHLTSLTGFTGWVAGAGDDWFIGDFSEETEAISWSSFNGVAGSLQFNRGPANSVWFTNVERLTVMGGSAGDTLAGGTSDDELIGNGGDDRLDGLGGDDRLEGGAGDDVLTAGPGDDWLDGGTGTDLAIIDRSGETRNITFSSSKASQASGQTLADGTHVRNVEQLYLYTGSGNDTASFGTLIDNSWVAGGGTDRLVVDFSREVANIATWFWNGGYGYGFTGEGAIGVSTAWNDILGVSFSSVEALTITTGSGSDTLYGGSRDDSFAANGGNDYLYGRDGDDRLEGGNGNDVIEGGLGQDHIEGGAGDDTLIGGSGIDWIDGGGGDDIAGLDLSGETREVVFSSSDAATSTGETLVDGTYVRNVERVSLSSGSGDDTASFDALRANSWSAGAGTDRLIIDFSSQVVNIGTWFWNGGYANGFTGEGVVGVPTAWNNVLGVSFSSVEAVTIATGSGSDTLYGGSRDDILIGNGANDYLYGRAGNDRLEGGDGDDTLIGGAGANFIDGGTGTDYAEIDLGGQTGSIFFSSAAAASDSGETLADGTHLRNVEKVSLTTGSGNDAISIRGSGQSVNSGAGDDELGFTQLIGRSSLSAGAGDDHLLVNLRSETEGFAISIAGLAAGSGCVGRGQSFDLAPFANYLAFDNVERLTVLGGAGNDNLNGLTGEDLLSGSAGNDYLHGNGGTDYLYGGIGDDILEGGQGDDTLEGWTGSDIMNGGQGADLFVYFASVESTAAAPDRITGFETGVDRIDLSRIAVQSVTWSVLNDPGGGVSNLVNVATADGDMVLRIDGQIALSDFILFWQFTGTSGVDHLRGTEGADLIKGEGGNDVLYVEYGGEDIALGGSGNDVIYFGTGLSAGDVADGGEGRDAVILQGNVTAVLSETNLVGIESISLQTGANAEYGDTADNRYDYDLTMADGNVAAGQQLIVNAQSLRVGEDFAFDGSAETDGSFRIYGGHGVDTLTGGDGNDIFFFEGQRWGPSDRVDGGEGRDSLVISAGGGVNHIEFADDSFTSIESISLNNKFATDPSQKPSYELVLANGNVAPGGTLIVNGSSIGTTQVVGIDGSAVHDGNLRLFGGAGNDTLIGGDGADTLIGGRGLDNLTGGAGADVFRYDAATDSVGPNADQVLGFQSGLDKIDVGRIDANTTVGGDQAFNWIGSNAFGASGPASAGELRVFDDNGRWRVEGDTNGDGNADFAILFQPGTAPPVQSDFLL